jgi:predicted Zn-dependent protease
VTPAPSVDVQPVAAAEAAAHAVTPAARARARQLIQRARVLAKDGKVAQAHDVAEDAIAADPECGSCWKTVALLRKKTGDRAGATLAKARADALGDDDTP